MIALGICILRIIFWMFYMLQIIRFIYRTNELTDGEYYEELIIGSFIFTMFVAYARVSYDLSDLADIKNVEKHILDIKYFVR